MPHPRASTALPAAALAPPQPHGASPDLRAVFAAMNVGVAQAELGTLRFLRANPAFCAMTGFDETALLAMTFENLMPPEDRSRARDRFTRLVAGETAADQFELRHLHQDGRLVWTEVATSVARDTEGRPLCLVAVIQDVTAREEAGAAAAASHGRALALSEATRILIEAGPSPDAVLAMVARQAALHVGELAVVRLLSADGQWLEPAAVDHPNLDGRGAAVAALAIERHPVDQGANGAAIRTARAQRLAGVELAAAREVSDPHLWPSLPEMPTRALLAAPMRAEGRAIGTLSVSRASDRPYDEQDERFVQQLADRAGLAIERARLFARVSSSEERLRLAVEANRMVAWEWDPGADRVTTSDTFATIYGLPALAGVAEGMALVWPEDLPAHQAKVGGIAREGGEYHSRFRITRPDDGRTVWLEEHATALTDDTGRVVRVVGIVTDVTVATEIEERRRQSEALLRTVIESTPDLIWAKDRDGRITLGNRATFDLLGGGDPAAVLGRGAPELVPDSEQARRIMENDARIMASGRPETVEEAFGSTSDPLLFQTIKAPLRDADGAVVGIVGVSRDITANKETEARLARLQVAGAALSAAVTPHEVYQAAMHAVTALGASAGGLYLIQGDDLVLVETTGFDDTVTDAYRRVPRSAAIPLATAVRQAAPVWIGSRQEYLARFPHLADQIRMLDSEAAVSLPLVAEGKVLGALTFTFIEPLAFDTGLRQFLAALASLVAQAVARANLYAAARALNERFARAEDAATAFSYEWDLTSDRVERSDGLRGVLGYAHEEIAPTWEAWGALIHPDDPNLTQAEALARLEAAGDAAPAFEYRVRHQDGSYRWISQRGTVIRDAAGGVQRVVGHAIDVTERRLAEEALAASEARFRALTNAVPSIIWTATPEGRISHANDQWFRYVGIAPEANATHWPEIVLHPDDYERCVQAWTHALATGEDYQIEVRNRRHDGEYRWFLTRAIAARDATGAITAWYGSTTDVHEAKLAQERLRESEHTLQSAIAIARLSPYEWNPQTGALSWDADLKAMWGLPPDAAVDYGVFLAGLHPDDRAEVERRVAQAIDPSGDGAYQAEFRVVGIGDGVERWVAARGRTTFAANGHPISFVGVAQDISERKRAEEALRRSEAIYRRLAEANLFGVGFGTSTGEVTFVNDEMLRMMGRTREEFEAGQIDWAAALAPEFRESIAIEAQRVLREGSARGYEGAFLRPDGGRTPYIAAAALVEPGADHHVSIALDLTQIRAAEAALRESEARFRTMADETPVIIWATDAAGGIEFVNRAYRDFFGVTEEEVLGPNWQPLVHPDDAEAYVSAFLAALRDGNPFHAEARVRRADGAWRWIESFGAPRLSVDGEVLGMVGSSPDITAREEADAERVAFLDAVAHDLKNPIGVVKVQAQLARRRLHRGSDDPARLEASLTGIEAAANTTAALIDELLDVAHLRAGRSLALQLAPTDLDALARTCAEEAGQRSLRHAVRIETANPAILGNWDAERLRRVLRNLLDNAVKYSPEGGEILVRVSRVKDQAGHWAELTVTDQGVGIPVDDLGRVFLRFHRGGNVAGIAGSGIGLAGAQQIVKQHGGTIGVASSEGSGSTFTVRLPLQPAAAASRPPQEFS